MSVAHHDDTPVLIEEIGECPPCHGTGRDKIGPSGGPKRWGKCVCCGGSGQIVRLFSTTERDPATGGRRLVRIEPYRGGKR